MIQGRIKKGAPNKAHLVAFVMKLSKAPINISSSGSGDTQIGAV